MVYKGVIQTDSRMVIGLGDKSVLEVWMIIDHLTGIPFIPSSSIEELELRESKIDSFLKK